jgi:hypothetical protein
MMFERLKAMSTEQGDVKVVKGDVRSGSMKMVATAVGKGGMATRFVAEYIARTPQGTAGERRLLLEGFEVRDHALEGRHHLDVIIIADATPQKLTGCRDPLHHLRVRRPALLRDLQATVVEAAKPIAMKEIVYHGLHSARVIAHEWI